MAPRPTLDPPNLPDDLDRLRPLYLADEDQCVRDLLESLSGAETRSSSDLAHDLIREARATPSPGFMTLLQTYRLDSDEGRALLTLAEALLRVPDSATADQLINACLTAGNWSDHQNDRDDWLARLAKTGLDWSARYIRHERVPTGWHPLLLKLGDSVFRTALQQGLAVLADTFVIGQTMDEALNHCQSPWRYSFDMLGEAAQTQAEAERYYQSYQQAIQALQHQRESDDLFERDGISIKLSALHPRYELHKWSDLQLNLLPQLIELVRQARDARIPVTLDAEESDRLELSLALFSEAASTSDLQHFEGFGLAVQAYQKRATAVIDWLTQCSRRLGRRIPVRLVKGAYWDTEIKRAQQQGLSDYPLFTHKTHTDLSYLACARRLLEHPSHFYPQFATHNAHTLAWVHEYGRRRGASFEVQRLLGMGEPLHTAFIRHTARPCRIYAPVGPFHTLLPYLVRRMLENGSNQSFVYQLADPTISPGLLARGPWPHPKNGQTTPQSTLVRPQQLYSDRPNSPGVAMSDLPSLQALSDYFRHSYNRRFTAASIIDGQLRRQGPERPCLSPADLSHELGHCHDSQADDLALAWASVSKGFENWSHHSPGARAMLLNRVCDQLEAARDELLWLLIHEGGKTLADAVAEWREAIDYSRYYASQLDTLNRPLDLPGVTGEANRLSLHPRGVFVCISPWNFPLAIFLGQMLAALAAGNTVIAKPASQTPLLATAAVQLLLQAGIPATAIALVIGPSSQLAVPLLEHANLAGVAFTGACDTGRQIWRRLADSQRRILPLIAETGGLNALIADSSALPDQLVNDVIASAFNSAGQRCSALRVLWLQEELLPLVTERLSGAMAALRPGHPAALDTDVGPVIDATALRSLQHWSDHMRQHAQCLATAPLPASLNGHYVPPQAFLVSADQLPQEEVFGPILHIATWRQGELTTVLDRIHASGYGLTLGVHSRIRETLDTVAREARVGNIYLNRNQIGAVVGSQPFGGEGLSGTGFKAGGPHYLLRFMTERVVSENTAALGINPQLLHRE